MTAPSKLARALALAALFAGTAVAQDRTALPLPGSAHGPGAPLELSALEQMALRHNPTVAQAAAKVDAARGRAYQSGLYPNPKIAYDPRNIGQKDRAGDQGGFLEQEIVTGGKLQLNRAKFGEEVRQAEWQAAEQRCRVLNTLRIRYYEVLARRRELAFRADGHAAAEAIAREAQAKYEEAERQARSVEQNKAEKEKEAKSKRTELLSARSEARRARLELEDARRHEAEAWLRLVTLAGTPTLPPTTLADILEADGPPLALQPALAELLQQSPELQAARARIRREDVSIQRERAQVVPNLTFRAGALYSHSDTDVMAYGRLEFPIPIWDRNPGNIRTATADAALARQELARRELEAGERLAGAFGRYEAGREAVREYREFILPETREVLEHQLESYRKGEADYSKVREARKSLAEASTQYVHALLELRRGEVEICGFGLVDGLTQPPNPPSGVQPQRNINP